MRCPHDRFGLSDWWVTSLVATDTVCGFSGLMSGEQGPPTWLGRDTNQIGFWATPHLRGGPSHWQIGSVLIWDSEQWRGKKDTGGLPKMSIGTEVVAFKYGLY